MPEMDGIEFLKKVRNSGNKVPFILFTGRGHEEVVIQALNEGADFYLQKGGDPKPQFAELSHKIRQAIQRRLMEKAVRISEERLSTILNSAQVGIILVDAGSHKIIQSNSKALELLSASENEVTGTICHKFICPSEEGKCPVTDLGQTVNSSERILIKKDGSQIPVIKTVVPIQIDNRNVLLESFIDISERKKAEKELLESEMRFRTLADVSLEGVMIHDKGVIVDCNPQFAAMFGYTQEEIVGRNGFDFMMTPESRDAIFHWGQRGFKGTIDIIAIKKDGTRFDGETAAAPINWHGKKHIIVQMRDITSRKENEKKFSSVFYRSPAVSIISNLETNAFIEVNDAAVNVSGFSRDEIIGKTAKDLGMFVHYEDRDTLLQAVCKDGKIRDVELQLRSKTGSIHTFLFSGELIQLGNCRYMLLQGIDITERKSTENEVKAAYEQLAAAEEELRAQYETLVKSERDLRESEERYRLLVERSPDAVILHASGRIVYANPASVSMLGAHRSENILGHSVLEFVHPDYRGIVSERVQIMTEKSQLVNLLEEKFLRLDGSSIDVDVAAMPVEYHGIPSVQVTFRDITTRKKAVAALRESEEKIRESEEFLRTVITGAKEGIIVYDRDLNIRLWNRFMEDMTGLMAADVVGENALDLFPFHKEIGNDLLMMQALEGNVGASSDFEFVIRATGKKGWAKSIFSPNHDAHGTIIGVIGMVRDITEQKRTEEALLLANKKLNLLSSVTRHDINNQLSVLRGYLTILEMKHSELSLNECLQKATNAVIRISTIIEFTKEYENIGVNAPAWHDCHALVEHAAIQTPLGQVVIKNDIPAGVEIFADPLIARVFHNLMDNAVRHGGKITTIRFSADESDGSHRMVCEDDGDGVPAQEKEKIFEREFGKNTGMGLFLAREILAITGISIRETGEPGKGARFEMMVPKAAYRRVDLKMNK